MATGYLELEPGWTGNCVGTHTFFPGFKLSEFWTVEEIKKIPNRCYSGEPDCITVGPYSQGMDSLQVDVSYDYSPARFDLRAWIYVIVKGPIGVPLHIRHT